ncbi:hypothetical protein HYC85_017427 [Camellia sinensis]|uniref:Gnk2-homologous domain-containing protein n=1 Tax=Camellia sinensis TaxID=4442 RepID=A0A7J7GRM5_CAMSI|nr:hypothetical protein HYC85_017427 [Camellia sinensis]
MEIDRERRRSTEIDRERPRSTEIDRERPRSTKIDREETKIDGDRQRRDRSTEREKKNLQQRRWRFEAVACDGGQRWLGGERGIEFAIKERHPHGSKCPRVDEPPPESTLSVVGQPGAIYSAGALQLVTKRAVWQINKDALSAMIFLMLSLFLLCDSVSADPKSISCDSSPTNYTPNSRFGNNLKILLESLSSNTPLNQGFNSTAIGNNTDQVYGQALCRGDVTPEVCRDCIKNASQEIMTVCPTQNAIIWHEFCQVRYAHLPFFSLMMVYNGLYPDSNKQEKNISDRVSFIKVLKDFMNKLSDEAIINPSNPMFVTGKTKFSRNESIYGLVQCTRDISHSDCRDCLNFEIGDLEGCCSYRQGSTIFSRNCNMRFQLYQFYNESTINGKNIECKLVTLSMLMPVCHMFEENKKTILLV